MGRTKRVARKSTGGKAPRAKALEKLIKVKKTAKKKPWCPKNTSPAWVKAVYKVIEDSKPENLDGIKTQLESLLKHVHAKQLEATVQCGTGVVMVDSNESLFDDDWPMYIRNVYANFTAGPNETRFFISFGNRANYDGDEEIVVGSNLFTYEKATVSEYAGMTESPTVGEIRSFLSDAGLENKIPERATAEYGEEERLKWVFCDVIYDAVEAVVAKYGQEVNGHIDLGMHCEDISLFRQTPR